jgi:ketosteroid isomerase-like protein
MKKLIPVMLATVAALAMTGCMRGPKATADTSKIEDSIKAQEAQWEKAYADKDLNALAAEYSDDAALGGPGDPLATTQVDRRKAIAALVNDPNFKLSFATDRVLVASSGDLVTSRGHYTITMTDKATSKPVTSSGTYITVYKRQPDGAFKAVEDMIIPGPPPAAAAAAAAK